MQKFLYHSFRKTLCFTKTLFVLNLALFLSGVYTLLSSTPVKADSFYPSGNIDDCKIATVVGVQYNNLGGNGVNWDSAHIEGTSGSWIQSHRFTEVADITYPDAHRYPYIADKVAVPPNTSVEIGSWSYSYANHGVNVNAMHFFTSREDLSEGDLTRIGAGGTYGTINMNGFLARSGKYITTGPLGYFPDRTDMNGQVSYSFETIQPIQLQSFNATPVWNGANLSVGYTAVIRNVSSYNLCDIRFRDVMPSGAVYDQIHCINAEQSLTITYTEDWGTNYPTTIINDPATIWDNNWHEETQSAVQPSISNFNDPSIRPGVVMRDDIGAPANWNAGQPIWGQIERPPVIVTLIPYWFNSEQVRLDVPLPNLTVSKTVSDSDETNVESNDSNPGEEITYNITVRNIGGRADNVVITDDYDQSLIEILHSDGGNDNGNTITWSLNELQHNEVVNYTIRARVRVPVAHGTHQAPNTVTVDSDQTNPINDSTQTNITAEVRMRIDKTVSDIDETNTNSNHLQGGHPDNTERLSTYSIYIENSGDADAHLVTIHDNVSEIVRNGSVGNISNGGVLSTRVANGQSIDEIIWNIGDLRQRENRTVTFDVLFNAGIDDNTQINNTAEVRTQEVPTISDSTITTIHAPILEIIKDDGIESAEPFQTVHWIISVRNVGTGNAYDTEVYDLVPERMNVTNISDNGDWDEHLRRVVWNTTNPQYILNGSYNPEARSIWGESKTLRFDTTLDSVFPVGATVLENIAIAETSFYPSVQTEHTLPVHAYPENDIEKFVLNETGLENSRDNNGNEINHDEYGADADEIFGTDSDVYAIAGDVLKYTLVFRNTGNAHSPDTYIEDHLPKFITDENGDQYQIILLEDIFDLSDDIEVIETDTGFDIRWNIGELEVGEDWKIKEFRVRLNPNSEITLSQEDAERLIDNVSKIASENELVEIDTDNAVIQVNQPNAEITKDSDKLEYQSDEIITYSIYVENIGSSQANGVVKDLLPDGLEFVSSNFPEDQTIVDGQNLSFNVSLNAGESTNIQITAKFLTPVTDLSAFNNEVDYEYVDLNDNERPIVSDEIEIIVHAPILELEKVQELPEIVAPGQSIIYTINYRNTGTGYSPETLLTDSIPEHTSFIEFIETETNIDGIFDAENNEVSWNIGLLDPDKEGSVSFKVVINIPTKSGTEIRNLAVIFTPVLGEIESEVITVVDSSCCVGGFIWDDSNNDGKYDESEQGVPDVKINIKWAKSEYLEENSVDIYSEFNGHYEYTGLPYHTLLTVKVFKPEGFDNISISDEFKLILLPPNENGEIEDYKIDGVRYLTASGCINYLNAGIYRGIILAQTGQSIKLSLIVGAGLTSVGVGIFILLIKRKRKQK